MPMRLEGSCRCGAISFSLDSHTPYPYQRCYCSICRKSAGGGGYAINIMGRADTLKVKGKRAFGVWNAPIDGHKGSADRHYCKHCGTPLWVSDAPRRAARPASGVAPRSSDDGRAIRSSPDSPLEGTGFEPSVPREAASILLISVLVRADFSACRESSK